MPQKYRKLETGNRQPVTGNLPAGQPVAGELPDNDFPFYRLEPVFYRKSSALWPIFPCLPRVRMVTLFKIQNNERRKI
jgi:hypothetical protein